jgi:multidrug resistance efflux pump
MSTPACIRRQQLGAELDRARATILTQPADADARKAQLAELQKLCDLQRADLERYKKLIADQVLHGLRSTPTPYRSHRHAKRFSTIGIGMC